MANPLSYMVNPLDSRYFQTSASGDQSANLGGYRDSALRQVFAGLPGSEAFYRPDGNTGDTTDPFGVDPQLLQQYLQQMGYSIYDDPTGDGGTLRVMDGDQMLGSEQYNNDDSAFQLAALIAAGAVTAGVGSGYLGGGAAAGSGGIPLTAAEMGVGSFPAGSGFGFMPAGAAEAGAVGGGMTAGANALYAPAGFAGGTGSALAGGGAAGGAAGAGSLLGSIGSALTSPSGLANLGSAAIGLYGQNKAIGAMEDATNQSNEFNRYAFDTIRADNQPLVDMRNSVLPQIQGLLANPSSVMNDPGNQFQFAQGEKALANSAAGRGMTYSGAQGKALTRYGQDFASTKLDDSLRRLQSVAGLGQVGSNSNNAATANYANNAGNNSLNMGQANASMYGNMANIGGNALSNIFNPWQWDRVNGRGG